MTGASTPADDEDEPPLVQTVSGAVMALTFLVGFGLMFAGIPWFWVAFPVGFGGLLPAAIGLARRYESKERELAETKTGEEKALEELRTRYARGELSDEEFEQRVERLLETKSVDDAQTFLGGESAGEREEVGTTTESRERTTEAELE